MDVHSVNQRRKNMQAIRSHNTKVVSSSLTPAAKEKADD
jgi:hypothetical protein